jgi:hypothetical protein
MEQFLGTTVDVYIGLTIILAGGIAFMMGQAIARSWLPPWQVVAYSLLLAVTTRFFIYALFNGRMLLLSGYIIDAAVLMSIALIGFRITRVQMMVTQYPWLYERTSVLQYRALKP